MGQKLKTLAQVLCVLGMIASLILAIITWSVRVPEEIYSYWNDTTQQASTFWPGLLTLVVGCLLSWVGSWILYGFGLIVKNTEKNNPDDSVEIDPPFQPN